MQKLHGETWNVDNIEELEREDGSYYAEVIGIAVYNPRRVFTQKLICLFRKGQTLERDDGYLIANSEDIVACLSKHKKHHPDHPYEAGGQ